MRGLKLLAFCFLSSTACAQATEPSAPGLNQTFLTRISSLTLSTENLTGISKTGSADLIYALLLDTQRQNPNIPEEFGGLSSLNVRTTEDDTIVFDALTDQGHLARFSAPNPMTWATATPPTASQVQLTAITDPAGKPLRGANQIDSEGLAPTDNGFLISFERDHRLVELVKTGEGYNSQNGPGLSGFDGLESNGGMEALARLPNGQFLASAEYGPDRLGDPAAKLQAPYWIFDRANKAVTAPLGSFENQGRFGITDIRVLDQDVWVLKRSYDTTTKVNLSRLETCSLSSVLNGKPICSLKLALSPPFPMDNYEGLAVMKDPQSGGTLAFILSDDNFSPDQGTFLLAFRFSAPISPAVSSPGATP
ncbi:MAG: hypothetical protein CFE27_08830 [Alphaproteobacteria bacterium PA1]|nr:MAG: hypothetical protein CFE27_08830 [Alphaproteobacteria bacterium PA1]